MQILSVSYDEALLTTRALLLEREGYTVTSAHGFTAALAECRRGQYDLLIIGHSIPHSDKIALMESFRGTCSAPVLSLTRHGESTLDHAEYHAFPDEPQNFLDTIAGILGGKKERMLG